MLRRTSVSIISVFIFIAGCANQHIDKHQYYESGLHFLEKGNPNGAVIAFKKAIEKDGSYFEARHKLALAYFLQKKYEAAERELLKVVRLNPSLYEARLLLAKVHMKMARPDSALKEIGQYLMGGGEDPEAYEIAASLYAAREEYAKAEETMMKSLSLSPDRISSKMLLAEIYAARENTKGAETMLQDVLDADPEHREALSLYMKITQKRDPLKDGGKGDQ